MRDVSIARSRAAATKRQTKILGTTSSDDGSGFRGNHRLLSLSLTLTLSRRERGPILSDLLDHTDCPPPISNEYGTPRTCSAVTLGPLSRRERDGAYALT